MKKNNPNSTRLVSRRTGREPPRRAISREVLREQIRKAQARLTLERGEVDEREEEESASWQAMAYFGEL